MRTRFESFMAENRKLDDRLNEQEYLEFDHIMASLNPVRMGRVRSELVRRDLLVLARDARAEGQTLEQALGEDAHGWCSSMLAAGGYAKTSQTVLEAIYQLLGFISCWSLFTAMLAVLTLQWTLFTTQVAVGPAFVLCWSAMGAVWTLYRLWVAPRFAARRGVISMLRIVMLIGMLCGMNWLLGMIPGLGANPFSLPVPWLCLWGAVWILFLLMRGQRRRMLEREFEQLTGGDAAEKPGKTDRDASIESFATKPAAASADKKSTNQP